MGMIVRLQLTLKIAQFLLKPLGFLFERFDAMVDFGVLVAVLFDGHESSFKSRRNTSLKGPRFQICDMGAAVELVNCCNTFASTVSCRCSLRYYLGLPIWSAR